MLSAGSADHCGVQLRPVHPALGYRKIPCIRQLVHKTTPLVWASKTGKNYLLLYKTTPPPPLLRAVKSSSPKFFMYLLSQKNNGVLSGLNVWDYIYIWGLPIWVRGYLVQVIKYKLDNSQLFIHETWHTHHGCLYHQPSMPYLGENQNSDFVRFDLHGFCVAFIIFFLQMEAQ